MVSWERITQPTKVGALGVRLARSQNTALLGKLTWELMHDPNKLWVQVLRDKYLCKENIFGVQKKQGSPARNSIMKAKNLLQEGFNFKIGNGDTSFWFDAWLCKMPLCMLVPCVDVHDLELRIRDVWREGSWHLHRLHTTLPLDIVTAIQQLAPCLVEDMTDTWTWLASPTGQYSVKTAYHWLHRSDHPHIDGNWSWLWKLHIPANIQFFLWQFCHASTPVREVLSFRGVQLVGDCPCCNALPETLAHCFFTCPQAAQVWQLFWIGTRDPYPLRSELPSSLDEGYHL